MHSRLYRERLTALFHLLDMSFWKNVVGNVRNTYKDELQSIEAICQSKYHVDIFDKLFILESQGQSNVRDGKPNGFGRDMNTLSTNSFMQKLETANPGELSDNALKMCWQTLEKFEFKSRPKDRVIRSCSFAMKRDDGSFINHFIGGSMYRTTCSTNEGNTIHYFVVSDELIPPNATKRSRDDVFEKNGLYIYI